MNRTAHISKLLIILRLRFSFYASCFVSYFILLFAIFFFYYMIHMFLSRWLFVFIFIFIFYHWYHFLHCTLIDYIDYARPAGWEPAAVLGSYSKYLGAFKYSATCPPPKAAMIIPVKRGREPSCCQKKRFKGSKDLKMRLGYY